MRKHLYLLLLIIFLISCNDIIAQKDIKNSNSNTNINSNLNTSSSNFKINSDAPDILNQINNQSNNINGSIKQFPIDKTVNPENYIVGPNDIFTLGLYGYLNQQLPLMVNIEGTIIIPTVGEVNVDGLPLNIVKEKVISLVKKRYYSSKVSFVLTTPRSFILTVSSAVQKKIEVNSLTRTSDVISSIVYDTLNTSIMKYKQNNDIEFFGSELSLRNIEILRKDGSTEKVDLYKYYYTNDDKYNPYFKDGDLLKIPFGQLSKNYISINGAVQLGGVYEYNSEDNLETVINIARGFDKEANIDSIVIFRTNPETLKFEKIELPYSSNENFKIEKFDRLFVKFNNFYSRNLSVTVLGEVNRPGIYPINFKNTTLKEIVEIAGGFRSTAYLPLSIVFRRVDEEYQKRDTSEIFINMRANDLIVNEKDKLSFERDVLSKRNRMVVDFEKLFIQNDLSQNIILEDKDVIYINDDKKVVYVYGQVQNEGYVQLKEGANYEYYVEQAGGFSLAADESNTRIIKFNSRGWYKKDQTNIMSGDFIYVPKKSPSEFKDYLTIVATMIGVVASVITTYLLIKQNN